VTPSLICGAELALMSWEKISNKKKEKCFMRRKAFHEKFTNELHAAVCLCFGLVVRHIYTGGRYIYILR
jgi:hypothetical protein